MCIFVTWQLNVLMYYCVTCDFSLYLFKLGLAPQIQDLYGKINFTGLHSWHLYQCIPIAASPPEFFVIITNIRKSKLECKFPNDEFCFRIMKIRLFFPLDFTYMHGY